LTSTRELAEGDKAPDFSLPSSSGKSVKLSDLKGKNVVLYFYPKDDTPGCTKEACTFRDNLPKFGEMDAVILGVSKDSLDSHASFIKKYGLNFTLLSDEDLRSTTSTTRGSRRRTTGGSTGGTRGPPS